MDKKLFEETLKSLAQVDEPEYWETVYDTEVDPETGIERIVKRDVLVRGAMTLKKLKPHLHSCDYCDKTVTDQVVNIRLAQDPVPHWRYRCTACNCYLDPETKQPMPEDLATSLGKIGRYHKRKKEDVAKWAKPKRGKITKTVTTDNKGTVIHKQVEESENSTITTYFYQNNKYQ